MSWIGYQVTMRVLSPVHIGWRKLGNLQQTRPYVTGRNLWGALTARLVRNDGGTDYQQRGELVDQQMTFSYCYPSIHPEKVTLWPWGKQWDEFAWTFLGSYAATALQDGHWAEEGSLHETEFISPYTREGKPVFLVGYIFVQEACRLDWRGALKRLQLGGERGYGWGQVVLAVEPERLRESCCFSMRVSSQDLTFRIPKGHPLLAHTLMTDGMAGLGTIEPFVGRETETNSGSFGQRLSPPRICLTPGSVLQEEKPCQIQARGIWSLPTQGENR